MREQKRSERGPLGRGEGKDTHAMLRQGGACVNQGGKQVDQGRGVVGQGRHSRKEGMAPNIKCFGDLMRSVPENAEKALESFQGQLRGEMYAGEACSG